MFGVTRKNKGLEKFQRALCEDRWIFEGLWKLYHNEGLGEEADGERRGKRTLITLCGLGQNLFKCRSPGPFTEEVLVAPPSQSHLIPGILDQNLR